MNTYDSQDSPKKQCGKKGKKARVGYSCSTSESHAIFRWHLGAIGEVGDAVGRGRTVDGTTWITREGLADARDGGVVVDGVGVVGMVGIIFFFEVGGL